MAGQNERSSSASMLLVLVLLLVLGSFGLLIVALAANQTSWAWGSVVASLVAGALLFADWLLRRKSAAAPAAAPPAAPPAERQDSAVPVERAAAGATVPSDEPGDTPSEQDGERAEPQDSQPAPAGGAASAPRASNLDPAVEPGEEDTDAADVIAVSDLSYEVVVIDERPRYHLAECAWLADRQTIPLPVREARELGFTPCALCTPDLKLAARHRLARQEAQQ